MKPFFVQAPSPSLGKLFHLFLAGMVAFFFFGCSEDAAETPDEAASTVSEQENEQALRTKPATTALFQQPDAAQDYAAAWPYGFDLESDGLRSTVLALGDVHLSDRGVFALQATTYHQPSGKIVESGWTYELALRAIGRADIDKSVDRPTSSVHRPSSASFLYDETGAEVVYDHRSDGVKLFVHLENRPVGDGPVEVVFDQRAENLDFKPHGEEIHAYYDGKEVFRWKGLIAFDSEERLLPIIMTGERNELRFEVDDTDAVYPITVDPLATEPSWTRSGDQTESDFGNRLVTGDVNGDGHTDILISDPRFTGDLDRQGRVLLFLGTDTGFSTSSTLVIAGDTQAEQLGVSTQMSGDFADDGCSEIVVGAPGFDSFRGRVLHYRPYHCDTQDETLHSELIWSKEGIAGPESFGITVASGDFNCNGSDDLLISAPNRTIEVDGEDISFAGIAEIYHGDSSLNDFIEPDPAFSYSPGENFGQFGFVTTTIPETRGQAFTTDARCNGFAVSSPGRNTQTGAVYVFHHDIDGTIVTPPVQLDGDVSNDRFGTSLAAIPSPDNNEINGQRLSSLVIGAAAITTDTLPGYVALYEFDELSETLEEKSRVTGPHADSHFGFSLAGNLNINGDDEFDLVVGAPQYNANSDTGNEGGAFIYLGTPDGLQQDSQLILDSGQTGSQFGYSMAGIPNYSNGNDALLVGARRYDTSLVNDAGRVFLYPGQTTCTHDGEFYSDGDQNPDNLCEFCNGETGEWSTADDGVTCDQGVGCNRFVCDAGQCTGEVIDCDDGNPCTANSCEAGECAVTNVDEGIACDDDGVSCTAHQCDGAGTCVVSVADGECLIDGACFNDADENPAAQCQECHADDNPTDWSARRATSDQDCDNGAFCTVDDFCDAGQCRSGASRVCEVDNCFQAVTCSNTFSECRQLDPVSCPDMDEDNECTVGFCDPATGDCGSANVADGTSCSDGNICTQTACQSGTCTVTQEVACNDGNECTVGTCSEAAGGCEFVNVPDDTVSCDPSPDLACTAGMCTDGGCETLVSEGCLIDGQCVADGEENPVAPCLYCDAATSTTEWSSRPGGTLCAESFCSAPNEVTEESACTPQDTCSPPTITDCQDYICADGACLDSCGDDADCFGDAYCTDDSECSTDNRQPLADAGDDQFVNDDDVVTLNGLASSDPDDDDITYLWEQISGEDVTLNNTAGAAPAFVAPRAPLNGQLELEFQLVVNDGDLDSEPDTTLVSVTNEGNEAPVAIIEGPDEAEPGETVFLDGGDSFDPDGDLIIEYTWNHVDGAPTASISQTNDDSAINVTFPDAAEITEDTIYTIGLIVTDGLANSTQAEHDILVIAPEVDPEPEPGDDVGPDAGTPDAGFPDVGPIIDVGDDAGGQVELDGNLQGSGCLCSGTGGGNDTQGMLYFMAALGFFFWRKRRES